LTTAEEDIYVFFDVDLTIECVVEIGMGTATQTDGFRDRWVYEMANVVYIRLQERPSGRLLQFRLRRSKGRLISAFQLTINNNNGAG